jgi:hypothetical protein
MVEQLSQDPINSLLSEFGTRLNEIEEKQRLVKDRTILVGENLISIKDSSDKDIIELKKRIMDIESELKSIKQLNKRIVDELKNFARKNEVAMMERQMKLFNPIKEVLNADLRKIVKEELKKLK